MGTPVQGSWTEDYKKFPRCGSRLVAKQLATSARDDVTQSTPALLVFRLMIAMCAAGILGVNACVALADGRGSLCHPPKADKLVKLAFCWRLRRVMNGTRRASRRWADKVKFVFRRGGMVFWHPEDRYMLPLW